MVLAVWGFLHAVRRDDEIIRQIHIATVDPGPHRRLRYGAAIRTTATPEFRLWVNPVFVPIVGTSGCRGGDKHRREDESSHGIPHVMSHATIALVVGVLFLILTAFLLWMANLSRTVMANAAKEIAKDIRESTVAVKALSERIDKMER